MNSTWIVSRRIEREKKIDEGMNVITINRLIRSALSRP